MASTRDDGSRTTRSSEVIAACFWTALLAGVVLLSGSFTALPPPLLAVAAGFLGLSAVAAMVLGTREARLSGKPMARVLAEGFVTGVRWLAAFLP